MMRFFKLFSKSKRSTASFHFFRTLLLLFLFLQFQEWGDCWRLFYIKGRVGGPNLLRCHFASLSMESTQCSISFLVVSFSFLRLWASHIQRGLGITITVFRDVLGLALELRGLAHGGVGEDRRKGVARSTTGLTLVLDVLSSCLVCQQVKTEHVRHRGMHQPLPLLEWKWDCHTCDFVTSLPPTRRQLDTLWLIVDQLKELA